MYPPYMLLCPHCFHYLNPFEVHFECDYHERDEDDRAFIFDPMKDPGWIRREIFDRADCPKDGFLCRRRVCRLCHGELAHYAGHGAFEHMIALAGSRGSGKSSFLAALLHELMQRAAFPEHGLLPMFENNAGHDAFLELYKPLAGGESPRGTDPSRVDPKPIIVRLCDAGARTRRSGAHQFPANLICFDPPGELFQAFERMEFIRYLASASGIILTLDADWLRASGGSGPAALSESDAEHPSHVVSVMCSNIRNILGLKADKRIAKRMAVVLTKCDASVYPRHPELRPLPGCGVPTTAQQVNRVSASCRKLLLDWGYQQFVALAEQQFAKVRYFTCSALAQAPESGRSLLQPLGVIDPLLWTMHWI